MAGFILPRRLIGTGGLVGAGGGGITFKGGVSVAAQEAGGFDSSGEALDIMSIASTGDLAIVAMTSDANTSSGGTWNGFTPTDVVSDMGDSTVATYLGYRFIQAGDANPYVSGLSTSARIGLTVAGAVFGGVGSYVSSATGGSGSSGMPDPPYLGATGDLYIAVGHLDDDNVTASAMADYTLAVTVGATLSYGATTTAIAYRIVSDTSQSPAAFGGSGSDDWRAYTMCFAE